MNIKRTVGHAVLLFFGHGYGHAISELVSVAKPNGIRIENKAREEWGERSGRVVANEKFIRLMETNF